MEASFLHSPYINFLITILVLRNLWLYYITWHFKCHYIWHFILALYFIAISIINTIVNVEDLIENYRHQISNRCHLLNIFLKNYSKRCSICGYDPMIIKPGIYSFINGKNYVVTSCAEGINNISNGEVIIYSKRPFVANMCLCQTISNHLTISII